MNGFVNLAFVFQMFFSFLQQGFLFVGNLSAENQLKQSLLTAAQFRPGRVAQLHQVVTVDRKIPHLQAAALFFQLIQSAADFLEGVASKGLAFALSGLVSLLQSEELF